MQQGPTVSVDFRILHFQGFGRAEPLACDQERFRPAKSEVLELVCDNAKAKALLGWEPQYTLLQGLQKTFAYIQEHGHLYKTHMFTL